MSLINAQKLISSLIEYIVSSGARLAFNNAEIISMTKNLVYLWIDRAYVTSSIYTKYPIYTANKI